MSDTRTSAAASSQPPPPPAAAAPGEEGAAHEAAVVSFLAATAELMRANAHHVENDAHHLVAFAPALNGCTDVLKRAMHWLPPPCRRPPLPQPDKPQPPPPLRHPTPTEVGPLPVPPRGHPPPSPVPPQPEPEPESEPVTEALFPAAPPRLVSVPLGNRTQNEPAPAPAAVPAAAAPAVLRDRNGESIRGAANPVREAKEQEGRENEADEKPDVGSENDEEEEEEEEDEEEVNDDVEDDDDDWEVHQVQKKQQKQPDSRSKKALWEKAELQVLEQLVHEAQDRHRFSLCMSAVLKFELDVNSSGLISLSLFSHTHTHTHSYNTVIVCLTSLLHVSSGKWNEQQMPFWQEVREELNRRFRNERSAHRCYIVSWDLRGGKLNGGRLNADRIGHPVCFALLIPYVLPTRVRT